MVLFTDAGDQGEFRTPGQEWTSIGDIPERPGEEFARQVCLINALTEIDGVGFLSFRGDTIKICRFGKTWDELRPSIEAVIEAYRG